MIMVPQKMPDHSTSALSVLRETFPIRGQFRIARGAKTDAAVVVAVVSCDDGRCGRGECVPYARYGETVDGVVAALDAMAPVVAAGLDRSRLQQLMPAGAARNALDCALWDLDAKRQGTPAWRLAGLTAAPQPLMSAFTLSVDTPQAMATAATTVKGAQAPLLKLKLTGDAEDLARVEAVRQAVPAARLIVDANEAWDIDRLRLWAPPLAALGVELIEQPLPADDDAALSAFVSPVALGADESCHDRASLPGLQGRYQVVNIKLDKAGGLTEALALKAAAETAGFAIMVGCMVASSLAMAPAVLVGQGVRFVDLDGPLLLATDRTPGLEFSGTIVHPPEPALWG